MKHPHHTTLERAMLEGRLAPDDLPPVRLDPILWAPAPVAAKPGPSAEYRVRRFLARPFRSAFRGIVSGERERRVLLKVAAANARAKDAGR